MGPTLLVRREVNLRALVVPIVDSVVGLKVMACAADRLDLVDTFAELVDGHCKTLHRSISATNQRMLAQIVSFVLEHDTTQQPIRSDPFAANLVGALEPGERLAKA